MDVNSRDPSQNIIPFRIKGVEVGRFDICGNLGIGTTAPTANLDVVGNVKINGELYVNGNPLTSLTSGVVVNMDSQPVAATALNRQKKQSIPIAAGSTLATSDVIAKMSGVSVGKTQTYGVGPAQMASYGNIVVAVGSGTNSIAYSLVNPPTASSWVGIPNSAATFTTQGWNIAYANGTWVAVGEGTNAIAYSTTTPPVASSWVGIPTGTSLNGVVNTFGTRGFDIAYGNGAWVAVGVGTNSISYSLANPPTAESWVAIPVSFSPTIFGSDVSGITFGNGTWVATGSGTNGIAYSTRTPPTADSWNVVSLSTTNDAGVNNIPTTRGLNVIYANGVWLAAGGGTNTLCYSVENPPIAGSWMPITTGVLFGTTGRSLAYGNGVWVACGESGTLLAYSTSRIPHSSSWVSMKGPTPSSSGEQINNVTFNAATNTWYFTGDIGTNCMFYSTATPPVPATWIGVPRNASTFTTQAFGAVGITTPAFTSPVNVARLDNKVTFPANRMLAVGGGGADVLARSANTPPPAMTSTISYSDDDGVTWQMVPGGATNAMFSSAADIAANTSFGVGGSRGANAVAWNGEKWVAAGNGRTHSLAFSDDGGMTWSGITGKSIFSVEARDVAWNGRMWVAVGRGINFSTAYSYDGVTWMGPVTDDVSGTPINVFSLDIAGPSAAMSDISGGGNHVIWTGKMWVATGTRTLIAGSSPAAYYTVAYSLDGKSWTGVPESGATSTGFDIYAHGVAWNGRNFVATGRGTVNTLVTFTDASVTTTPASWQGLGNSVFSIWGRGVTWGARRWMATGRGTNTVAYSTNGRNWQGCGANVFKPMRRFMAMGDTGVYTTVSSGQPQRGVAFTYSDDGVTWDAPVVNQAVEFSRPLGGATDTTRSVVFTNNTLITNVITDNSGQHTALMYSTDAGASWARVPGTSDTEANGGTGMTPANNGAYSLAMNPTRTRFIATGGDSASVTRKVYFSNDGFNWRNSVSSPNSTQMAWVHSSLWVGGGYNHWLVGGNNVTTQTNGMIMYSGDPDAVAAWTAASGTFTSTIISCFAANTDFSVILAGATSGNVIYRSVNGGVNWTTVSISGTPTGSVRSIAFSPALGRWVAVGGGSGAANTIIYSTDATGTAWLAPPLQAKTAATAIFKNGSEATRVIWDAVGARFLVGGWNGTTSSDTLTNVFGLDLSNNNPGYTMAYSSDGVNWTPVTVRSSDDTGASGGTVFGPFLTQCREIMALDVSGDFTPINTGYSVTWNSYANRFVATGNGTTPVVYSSDGGVTWMPANQQSPQQAIAVAGGASAAANTTSVSPITYTIDGKIWSQGIGAKEVFGSSGTVLAVRYGQTSPAISPNGRIWVAGGTASSGISSLAFSQNGIRWTPIANATTMITNVRAIAYAPADQVAGAGSGASVAAASGVGNGVWVAGGDTTNSLIFSYDGISWSEVPNSLTILNRCNAIAFGSTVAGSGVFVAGGLAGTLDPTANMAYSTDGLNWQPIRGSGSRISTGGASINCITYGRDETGRGLWVAGAFGSSTVSILYSYNGIDWVGVVGSGGSLSSTITGLAYGVNSTTGRGLWVASVYRQTSDRYSFLFSANGRDGWTSVLNTKAGLFELNTSGATNVAYLNGVWYATGLSAGLGSTGGRTLAYSYEGSSGWFGVYPTTNLYGVAVPTYSTTDMRCVATTGEFVIPMGAGAALTPVRGLGWTAGVGSAYLQHPTILFGSNSGTQQAAAAAAMSTDGGRSWGASTLSIARSAFRGGDCNDAFWNGIVWAAVGYDAVSGAKVATSKDGVTWTQIPAGSIPIAGVLYSIMWNGTVWMVGGDGSPTNDANTASIAWSADLAIWTGIANTDTKLRVVKRIAWNGMYWTAAGVGDVSIIMHSTDKNGLKWEDTFMSDENTNKTANTMSSGNDVVWGGGRWVAVGRPNSSGGSNAASILYSVDTPAVVGAADPEYAIKGRRWTGVAGSAQLFPYGANSVSWNGKRFVATGPASCAASTGNIIAWSADGIAWTAYSSAKTVAPGQRWVAVGSGSRACIALSADGRVWTDVSGSAVLFPDISGATATLVSSMKTGARAIGWNGNSLVVGGARAATTVTASSTTSAATMATTGRTTIPVCAFIGSGNGVMGGGTTNIPDASFQTLTMRASSSVFITHMDVNMRESLAPWANMWLNTYTDLSGTQLFQVTPETQTFSSALKWNGWSWVANFGMTTFHPQTGEQYGSLWYCTDPLARVGWSVASNSAAPRILIGQGGYAALEWNGVAWLACGYDPNNNNLIYTTDRYGATGWTTVSGIVNAGGTGGGSASFQPVCIAASPRFWVVGGSQVGAGSAIYYTSDRTGATGWRAVTTTGVGASVLPAIRITSVGYNGTAWICCGGGRVGTDSLGGVFSSGSISWRADPTGTNASEDFATGWAAATVSGTSGGIPPITSASSAIATNVGAGVTTPIWVVVGEDLPGNSGGQIAYTTDINGSSEWKRPATGTLTNPTFGRLNGIAWTGYSWIVTSGAGFSRLASTTDPTAATQWNNTTNGLFTPTLCTNAVAFANIPISLLTTGMPTSAGSGAGAGAMWRGGVGRAQGLLPGGGAETTSVVVRSSNGAEGTSWSQTYSRNFLIAVGGGVIRDASNGGGLNRMAFSYDGGLSWTTNNTAVLTNAATNAIGSIRTVKYGNGMWVAGGDSAGSSSSGGNCLAWSRDGVNWTGAGGTQIFGSAGACYAVCCNDRGRWVAVGGAALGTAGTYTNTSGAIYTMAWSDDGMNWTPILGSRALFGIVCQGVTYGADASGVGMWTAIGRGTAYTGCAYSYDGKTWYLSQTSGSLFGTSANVLTERYAPVVADWRTVAINSTGQIQFAAANAGLVYRSVDYGVTWSALTLPSRNWTSVAVSSTGQYVVAASSDGTVDRLYNSSDYGVTWMARGFGSNAWVQVAISATGQYQVGVATSTAIQISRDYGMTWQGPPTSGGGASSWTGIAISASGQYITAVGSSMLIQQSSDYGLNFTVRSISANWSCVAMSSTGQIQISSNNNNCIQVSINYGVDWNLSNALQGTRYRSVAISSTGQYRSGVLETASGTIQRSNNYDAGWSSVGVAGNYFAIAMSSTGQYQTAVSQTSSGNVFISSNFGETWSSGATDSRSLGIAYGKDASGVGMWVATAGRRDRDVSANIANTMAYSYDGKLWRGIRASAGLSEQAWSVAYGKDGFGVGMWVAAGYDTTCGLKWSYDGVTWNASMGASGAAVWAGMAAGRRALCVYWNGSMWLASTSDTRNGEPRGTTMAANNASSVPGYLLYSYNGKNWLPVLAPNTYAATNTGSAQTSVYSVLPNPAILDFGSFYDDQAQRGVTIANTTARTVGAVMSGVPIENVNTIVPYGRGSLTTGQVPFLMGGDSGLVDSVPGTPGVAGVPVTSELAASTTSLSTSTDGGMTWRAVPNSTKVMTKVNKIHSDETTQQIVAVGTGNYSVATSTPATAGNADGWVGVFGSRMMDTRAGLFEKYGTGASWFGGAKMWIASGRAQSRRGSSLAVSVNGTVWQDAKIVSQMAAGSALGGRGGGLTSRTTTGVTMNSALIPYTAPATPLVTYTDSAAAFSTQVSSVAVNSQYNRAVVGGSGIQFVAGGRGGLAVSNDGQNWTAATATVFQTPTNVAAYSTAAGSGGFDASFGTVALTQRLTTPATYPSGDFRGVSVSKIGQYQTAVIYGGNIWTSSDFGVTWTERTTGSVRYWYSVSISSSGQYQSAGTDGTNIWTSSDYGITWTERTAPGTLVSLSSTGQYQTSVVNNGNIWTSSDYGVFWTSRATSLYWRSVSLSSTGQFQIAVSSTTAGNIWVSSDFGVSWSIRSTGSTRDWISASLSSTGQYQTAVVNVGNIWCSSDFGVTWTQRTIGGTKDWRFVSLSSTGQYQTAVIQSGNIWTSSDYGVSWTERTTGSTRTWFSVSLSSTGQYQTAVVYTSVGNIWTSSDFGVTWVQRSTNTRTNAFTRIKSSASGQYQLATSGPVGNTNGQLYVSSDYGQSWIPRRGLGTWLGGAVSATGGLMTAFFTPTAATAALLRSTDFGNTFTEITGTALTGAAYWRSIAITNSGATQTALAHGSSIYRSSDYGSTWNSTAAVDVVGILSTEFSSVASPTYAWKSIAMSADAKYQTGVVSGSGRIYVNTNYGREAWTAVDSSRNWAFVAMSADGRYQSAVASGGSIYYNSTFGTGTWTAVTSPTGLTWTGIAVSSADGKYQIAVASGPENIRVNSNFGVGTWVSKEVARNWSGVAISSTGRYQTAIHNNGFIYIDASFGEAATWTPVLTDTPRAWASVAMSGSGQYQTAVVSGGKIYANNNFGASGAWVETEMNRAWISVAVSSATGRYQTAVAQNAQIYINTNFGLGAWTAVDNSRNWVSVAVSSDGKYQSAVVATSGQVYFSRNFGSTWSTTAGLDIMGNQWQDIAVSAETGAVQVTCVSGGYLYVSSDTGANWVSTTVSIDGVSPQATNRTWQAVALSANGQFGLACVNSTTASGYLYRSTDSGATWMSSSVVIDGVTPQTTNRPWQDVGMSANGKYQVACVGTSGLIYYSKDYGANWTSLTAAGSRAWSSVALSENGSTISATTSDSTGGVWVYTMPDDRYYRSPALTNVGSTTTPATVRAIAYGNSGTGAAVDGYWVAGADASANSLAYSSNGSDWTAVVGSKTTLFNSVNGVAYGADTSGTPMWVAVGVPFVGSLPGSTAFSIAYSYNMTTWVGVRNAANFTGQGNHVAYGQDEFGAGVWVAVGQADGVLATNLGNSSLYNSNGTAGTTIFYSYDGANWAAGTGLGIFAVAGTDVAWGVDASGVGTWVATGIGFTDPLTGVVLTGGQVAHSTNGRVWTPIRAPTAIVPAMAPTTLASRGSAIPPPPASSGVLAPVYGNVWNQLGSEILGTQQYEQNGWSVSVSADGTTVAIGSYIYDVTGTNNEGRTRIYKYNTGTSSWVQFGSEILGTQRFEYSGASVSLSADGTTVAIGSYSYDKAGGTTDAGTDEGRTRVYKYNTGTSSWTQLGLDISGTQANENSGWSVSLSADGTTVAMGSYVYDVTGTNAEGRTRVYKYNTGTSSWTQLGLDISGTQLTERSGYSVSLSADGTTVAVGSYLYDTNNADVGRTRVYKYNTGTSSWVQLGLDISGTQVFEYSGASVSLSADGTTVAIGSYWYDKAGGTTDAGTEEGRTRVYKYNTGTSSWGQLGSDIMGTQQYENSGWSVSLSADGTMVAVGSRYYDVTGTNNEGRTRIYKYIGTTWTQLGSDIMGTQTNEYSGYSVSLSADGTTVAVGHYLYDKAGGTTDDSTSEGRVRIYKIDTFGNVTYSISNPAIADIYANTILSIKEGVSGTATITAVQAATPPYTAAPVTVQGTLTVTGTVYTLVYNNVITTFTPFTTSALTVAYGRAGSQGTGAPLWMVGGAGDAGGNVFAMSSAPTTTGAWSVVASANAPFPTCNSIGYSNGVWVASNNTDAANIIARSTDGGTTWTPVTASSVSGILTGAAALGANAFCNYSLAYADYSNDTNLRSWVAVQGTKNFFFEGGVSAVATVTPDVSAGLYNIGGTRAWWVAGGVGLAGVASIGTTTDPSGATGWTKATSPSIANLASINAIAFSPHTQRWLAVGAGATGSLGTNVLTSSDATGTTWTAGAVTSALTPVITLNTCIWNQLPASASAAGRWLAAGTRDGGVGANSACIFISTDTSGAAIPWTPVTGTGAILSQVYSIAYNGSVWIAAGTPAIDNGSTSTLMRTADPTGATGWHGITMTNASTSGFDTAARSITWNADQQMWVATGENTGSTADASFSSVIYSQDINGATGTWRTVRESNSVCFSGEGTGVAFTGEKWFAVGDNGTGSGSAIVATSGTTAANAGASWTPVTHGTAMTRASDIAYTGRRLVATGTGSGATSGIIYSSNGTGANGTWTSVPSAAAGAFNDISGGATSITLEASYEGTGRLIATGRSATNALSVSTDGGETWTAPSTQYSSTNTFDTTTTPLFTTGGNSVAYVGNDTLFAGGGNDVHWNGKRWVATGRNSAAATATTGAPAPAPAPAPDVVNNNTTPVATSEDGITWQCVRASQAPSLTEGTFIGTNSRIGATPLINSQITITDGGDTESNADYGGMSGGSGGSGTGVAQIDIIAELTPVSNAAASVNGTVGIIGAAGNGGVNGIGHVTIPSFDNTAFTITTRPT